MSPEAVSLWSRAIQSLRTAKTLIDNDPDAAASRAYYAAFYAVSALLVAEGRSFSKHSAVEAAVHRDLVSAGRCPPEVGAAFSSLVSLRATGDYGVEDHVSSDGARHAIEKCELVVETIRRIGAGALS